MTDLTNSTALPAVISTYLARTASTDPASAIDVFAPDAEVFDDGRAYHGRSAITGWLSHTVTEFSYTTTRLGVHVEGPRVTVTNRLEGNFPGGIVDLHYRFTLTDDQALIRSLTIEP